MKFNQLVSSIINESTKELSNFKTISTIKGLIRESNYSKSQQQRLLEYVKYNTKNVIVLYKEDLSRRNFLGNLGKAALGIGTRQLAFTPVDTSAAEEVNSLINNLTNDFSNQHQSFRQKFADQQATQQAQSIELRKIDNILEQLTEVLMKDKRVVDIMNRASRSSLHGVFTSIHKAMVIIVLKDVLEDLPEHITNMDLYNSLGPIFEELLNKRVPDFELHAAPMLVQNLAQTLFKTGHLKKSPTIVRKDFEDFIHKIGLTAFYRKYITN